MARLLIHYRDDYFQETREVATARTAAGRPVGLVGRQVANAEMLRALLRHGHDDELSFLVHNEQEAGKLKQWLARSLPSGKRAFIRRFAEIRQWLPELRDVILWEPQPPSSTLTWIRHRTGARRVAISGVTHALCSVPAVQSLNQLILSPTRGYDRLVGTSQAVAHTARILIQHACENFGIGRDEDRIGLETIPLGIDCDRHRPATEQGRAEVRRRLEIGVEDPVVLFVGRLSHHAKSNPLPLFAACQRCAQQIGKSITLVLAGWFANRETRDAFFAEAKRIAPDVRLLHVDAMDPVWRDTVWDAADVFVSLADSVQETFGLTVVEAMSRGLPVIATDWNGYRETIRHEETGLLIPTSMVSGASEDAFQSLHEGHLTYDHFLAIAGQGVRVDVDDVSDAMVRLFSDSALRDRLGQAGNRDARQRFDWPKVIAELEDLWQRQRLLMYRREVRASNQSRRLPATESVAACARPSTVVPAFQQCFAKYPTRWVDPTVACTASSQQFGSLPELERSPLAGYLPQYRTDTEQTEQLVANCSGLDDERSQDMASPLAKQFEIDTFAWLLKFDLLRPLKPVGLSGHTGETGIDKSSTIELELHRPLVIVTTCKGRLHHLKQSLPRMIDQPQTSVVVVDYDCPDQTSRFLLDHFDATNLHVVTVENRPTYDRSESRNIGWRKAVELIRRQSCPTELTSIAFVDADMLLQPEFASAVRERREIGTFLRCGMIRGAWGRGGLIVVPGDAREAVGGYDPVFQGWGEEDEDLVDALIYVGYQMCDLPDRLADHVEHEDDQRNQFHAAEPFYVRWLINRIFRLAKWDTARLIGRVMEDRERGDFYRQVERQVIEAIESSSDFIVRLNCRTGRSAKYGLVFEQSLAYKVSGHRNVEPVDSAEEA